MRGNPVGAQHASERDDHHGTGPGPLQCGSGTLGPRSTDIGVVEEHDACVGDRCATVSGAAG